MYECKKVAYHPMLTHFSIVQCYIDNGFIFEWGKTTDRTFFYRKKHRVKLGPLFYSLSSRVKRCRNSRSTRQVNTHEISFMKEDIRNAFLLIVLEFNHEGLCFCFCFVFIAHWQLDSLFGYISHFTGEKRKKIAWYTGNF